MKYLQLQLTIWHTPVNKKVPHRPLPSLQSRHLPVPKKDV